MIEVKLGRSWNGRNLKNTLDDSYLLDYDDDDRRRQCCIGVMCSMLGTPDDTLHGVATLEALQDYIDEPLPLPFDMDQFVAGVYDINDNRDGRRYRSINQKVAAINELMNPLGVNFTYDKNAP